MAQPASMACILRALVVVLLAVLIPTLLTLLLATKMVHSRDLLFVAAIILVSRYQGFVPGMGVSVLSVLVFD